MQAFMPLFPGGRCNKNRGFRLPNISFPTMVYCVLQLNEKQNLSPLGCSCQVFHSKEEITDTSTSRVFLTYFFVAEFGLKHEKNHVQIKYKSRKHKLQVQQKLLVVKRTNPSVPWQWASSWSAPPQNIAPKSQMRRLRSTKSPAHLSSLVVKFPPLNTCICLLHWRPCINYYSRKFLSLFVKFPCGLNFTITFSS